MDTLLQLGEVARAQGDQAQASEYTERAIYAFERVFPPGFNLANGKERLDFRRVASRSFFLAVFRNIHYLAKRGCHRTALEHAKLLLQVDPEDPYCVGAYLDFLAIKSKSYTWLLDCIQALPRLGNLPGMLYATALAQRGLDGKAESSKADNSLRRAIRQCPEVVPLLVEKLSLTLPPRITTSIKFQVKIDQRSVQLKCSASYSSQYTGTLMLPIEPGIFYHTSMSVDPLCCGNPMT